MKFLFAILTVILFLNARGQDTSLYSEPFRPQYHFSPARNWTNDPNGLVYYKGEYHLFYQYNPYDKVWGHMSWAHSVSNDLVHWKSLPLAIPEDDKNMIFSGSCVVDVNNTSGFATNQGQVPFAAIYTAHIIPNKSNPDDYMQNQHIAYSLDNGRTWKKYSGNPVLDLHKKDFRDPFVFWHAPTKKWVMCVVLPHQHIVQFYSSPNLKGWKHLSDFGPAGDTSDIWECPSIAQVPIEGLPGKSKWVLFNSQQTIMQYFVGEFNGTSFHNETLPGKILRPDYGPDYYAAVVYNNLPAGRAPVLLGWANNWFYAQAIPTSPWRSAMSLPRELGLRKEEGYWTLLQRPVASLNGLASLIQERDLLTVEKDKIEFSIVDAVNIDLNYGASLDPGDEAAISDIILTSPSGDSLIIKYDAFKEELSLDRSKSGNTKFHKAFASWLHNFCAVPLRNGGIRLNIFFDKSIIEVYANDGEKVMTAQAFPFSAYNKLVLLNERGLSLFHKIEIKGMKSVWK